MSQPQPVAFYKPKGGAPPGVTFPTVYHFWDFDGGSGADPDLALGNTDMLEIRNACPGFSSGAPDGLGYRSVSGTAGAGDHFVSEYNTMGTGPGAGDFTAGVTVAGWFRMQPGAPTNRHVWGHNNDPFTDRNLLLIINVTGGLRAYWDGNISGDKNDYNFTDGAWHSFSCSADNASTAFDRLYVDGVSVDPLGAPQLFKPADQLLHIGAECRGYGGMNGDVCSFAVWREPLTDAQQEGWHNSGVNFRYDTLPT